MELCPKGFSAVSQLLSESMSDAKMGGWRIFSATMERTEVVCPEPCRANKVPLVVDGPNRFSCKPRSLNMPRGDMDMEILEILLGKDDYDFDSDTCGQAGFFPGSPPVRSSNPIIRDVEFVKQSSKTMGSPLGNNTPGGRVTSPRVERGIPCCGSPFGGKPKVRIEGFSSGNSESGCVVSALA